MKVALAQINPTVGDVWGNLDMLLDAISKASQKEPDLLVFPELCLTGYPPRDLLERTYFIDEVETALEKLVDETKKHKIAVLVGFPERTGKANGKGLVNAAALIADGKRVFTQHKSLLPEYDVFDEARYFDPAESVDVVKFKDEVLGITICEDAWNNSSMQPGYDRDPVRELAEKGATLFINLSASPFNLGKDEVRFDLVSRHAKKHKTPFILVNQVGANDELVFDGTSIAVDAQGRAVLVLASFYEDAGMWDTSQTGNPGYNPLDRMQSLEDALTLGIRDYVRKCGFEKTVLGLSGGADSSVVAVLAAKAMGPENVTGVMMPGPYSSDHSLEDARKLAKNLGINSLEISINRIYEEYVKSLGDALEDQDADIARQNIQARIRGNILMALSNTYGYLVLSTGNKSELAVGYCTLYGDMSGGLAAISDVPKTLVYALARHMNKDEQIIPLRVLEKPPSAELAPDQKDEDSLPPYSELDDILRFHVDESKSLKEIVEAGHNPETVKWVISKVAQTEYKRRQSPPGLKVTTKAFGCGRRMPIAAKKDIY